MTRTARIVVPGLPHHVTQRGNRSMDVFDEDGDRVAYLSILDKYARRYGLEIWAYCLMTNHVHLVAVPQTKTSMAYTLRETNTRYASWFNHRYDVSGHLWHGRYYSCVMDEPHLWAAVHYVECNPVRAGIVNSAEHHPWSSAAARCGLRDDALLSGAFPPAGVVADWRAWLADEDIAGTLAMRQHTRTGRPCGSETFVTRLESSLGRKLSKQRPGPRPPAVD